MGYRYAVLGAGMMGRAVAYDLARCGQGDEIRLLDVRADEAEAAAKRINELLGRDVVRPAAVDLADQVLARQALDGCQAVMSCLPFVLNLQLARVSLDVGAHFCDLGGNTGVVRQEMALDEQARQRGVSLVPDCGLAPGLVNVVAAAGLGRLSSCDVVRIRCGGLPQAPRGSLQYGIVFSMAGLINEYTGSALCLRGGVLTEVPALSEEEVVRFDGFPELEAFVTSGGSSLAPESFAGKVLDYDYKTIRYQGHVDKIRCLQELGLFSLAPTEVPPYGTLVPRKVFEAIAEPRLTFPEMKDLVLTRISCSGSLGDNVEPGRLIFELIDHYDSATGFTAMARSTGFAAAAICALQAAGQVAPGARPPERAVDPESYLAELRRRGLNVTERVERLANLRETNNAGRFHP